MEKSLRLLFDFQKFQGNERVQDLIDNIGKSQKKISLEDLELVNAAGDCFNDKRYQDAKDYKDRII